MGELSHSSRRLVAASFLALVALATALVGIRSTFGATPEPGAEQLSQQIGEALGRLAGLEELGPLADALPVSDILPGDALGLADAFDDDAPDAVGAAEDDATECHDDTDDDGDGVADDGCGDDPSVDSLSDRFLNEDGTGKLVEFDDIADALQIDEDIAGVAIEISEPTVADNSNSDGIDFVTDPTTGDIDLAVVLQVGGTIDAPVALPTELIDLVAVGGEGIFEVPVQLLSTPLHLHFEKALAYDEVNDVPAPTVAESLWIQTSPDAAIAGGTAAPALSLSIGDGADDEMTDIAGELNLGFAGVDVEGLVALQLLFNLSLIDPDSLNGGASDFKIGADEIVNTDLTELFSISEGAPSGDAVDATFTIKSDLVGGADDVDLTITANAPTIADIDALDVQLTPGASPLQLLQNLRSFTATDALGAVDRLVGMLGNIQSTGYFDLDIPYVEGGTCGNGQDDDGDTKVDDGCLGSAEVANGPAETGAGGSLSDVLSFASELGAAVTDTTDGLILPPDPETLEAGLPSFANAQELQEKLISGLGAALEGADVDLELDSTDPAHPKLVYSMTLQDTESKALQLRLGNLAVVNDFVITAGGNANLQAGYSIPIEFALDLTPEPVEDGGTIGSCTDGEDNGGSDGIDAFDTDCATSRTLEQRVSVFVGDGSEERPEVLATAGLQATNINATARIGFLSVGLTGGSMVFGPATGAEDCDDAGDLDDAECLSSIDLDLVDTDDGWLTLEELYDALGSVESLDYDAAWSRTVDHSAGLWANLPIGATLEGVTIPGGAIEVDGSSTGLLFDSTETDPALAPFDVDALVESLQVNASALEASDLFGFSACGNGKDDDGDGTADDGCGDGDPAAIEAPESESTAMFDLLLSVIKQVAQELDADALPAAFQQDLPFIGKSYADVVDMASALADLAEAAALGAESFLGPDACTNGVDDDGDTFTNDGCPTVGGFAEGDDDCVGTANDDSTLESNNGTSEAPAAINDGCPAVAPSLQDFDTLVDRLLSSALGSGLDTTIGDGVITVDTDYDDATQDLSFAIDIADFSVDRTFPFVADLGDLPTLASLSTAGAVAVEVSGSGNIDFGVDLDDLSPYVLGSTDLQLQIDAELADPTTFEANVGPIEVNVGKTSPGAESGTACDAGNTTDEDLDGYVNDGCGPEDAAETGADCSYGDAQNQDGDGLVNDGCPARTDSVHAFIGGRLHIVETHGDDTKVPLTDVALGGGLAGGDVVGGVDQPECVGLNISTAPQAPAGAQKHACAILPLYLGDTPVGTAGTTQHHVLLAVNDLSDPSVISFQFDGAAALDEALKDAVLDLLLLKSGILPLIEKLTAMINGALLSVDLPVIGDALGQVVKVIEGLNTMAGKINEVLTTDPVAALGNAASAELVTSTLQELADDLGEAFRNANILLEPGVAARTPADSASDLQVKALCGDEGICDFGGEDETNPALDRTGGDADDDTTNNCDAGESADEDVDGYANDGCDAQPNPETDAECSNGTDDDGDGAINDGCPDVAAEDEPETACDGVNDDGDGTVDDGCDWPETNPAGDGSDPEGGEKGIDGACDEGDTADDDGDGFINDGCDEVIDTAADITDIAFLFRIGQAAGVATGPIGGDAGFSAGIPGLGLELENANLQANAGWDLDIGIGVSKDHGFYFVTDEAGLFPGNDTDGVLKELNANATVLLSDPGGPAASLTGHLAFLEAKATDGSKVVPSGADNTPPAGVPANRSFFDISIGVDLEDPGATDDKRLALSEIVAGPSFSDLIDFSFTGRAELHLGLEVGVSAGEGLPRLTTGVHLTWGWNVTAGEDPGDLEPQGDQLKMWMDGLYIDAGSFVSEFLAPILADVQKFTKPFEPIIDVLNEPIPVLSDFAGEPVTMRTLGEALAAAYDIDLTLLDMVIDLIDFVNSIKTFDGGTGNLSLLIPLTDTADQRMELAGTTLRQGKLASSQALSAFKTGELSKMVDDLQGAMESKVGDEGSASSNESSGGTLKISSLDSVGISFPFLEHPERLAGLLFGQHVTLIQWEPPPLVLKFCYSQKFGPIWAVPPVFIEFGGCITLTGEFGIGYNTKGFERALFDPNGDVSGLLQGLFLIDRHPLEGGSDTNELNFRGEIFVNAQVSVLIFSAGAQGSLYLEIGIDLEDPNNDGITEYGEAANIIRTTGSVLCLFNLNGKLGLEISVFAEVDLFFWSQRWTKVLADIILYEFKIKCEPLEEPDLARGDGSTLYLNMGADAKYRDDDDSGPDNSVGYDVIDEKWTVTRTATGVKVRALGFTQEYPGGWTKVVVTDAGEGEDAVSFLDGQTGGEEGAECDNATDDDGDGAVNDGCDAAPSETDPTLPVPENAPSNGGDAADCTDAIDGDGDGKVNDGCPIVGEISLIPFDIAIDVSMGNGPDTVNGGVKGGTIKGGAGPDVLVGRGDQKYVIHGGSEGDGITAGHGDDEIYGEDGDDAIDAGAGGDKVVGGGGDDTIDGGRTVKSDPQVGPVVTFLDKKDIVWGDEENTHGGTGGKDTIDGGEGDDELNGGGGADRISGSVGADTIKGGDESDDGCASTVDDTIVAGPGKDTVDAMAGDDIVVGGNTIAGQPDEGDAKLDGGPGCDIVLGDNAVFDSDTDPRAFALLDPSIGGAEESIKGGTGDDIVRGQKGDDIVFGDTDDASGSGDGADQIWGDAGSDTIQGGGGGDTIWGDGGPSHPQLQPHGNDVIAGAGGGDVIRGEGGTDTIFGGHGKVSSGSPVFTASSADGNDNILGGPDADRIYGQEGGDVVNGDGGDDEIHGDTDTTESGGDGRDDLRGGTGNDVVFGGDDADTIYGDAGDDDLGGGSQTEGNDDSGVGGSGFQDLMFGGSGADQMTGDNADLDAYAVLLDEATIGEGDLMLGQLGDDVMFGENGDDLMLGGAGDDHMEGGADSDTIYGEADQDDIIGGTTEASDDAAEGTFGQQPDDGDFLYGQGDADVIVGDNGQILRSGGVLPGDVAERVVTLWDLDSKDVDLSGDDLIEGGMSTDAAYGGSGADVIYGYTAASAGAGEDLADHLEGNDGGDTIEGDADQDSVIGGTSAHVDEGTDPDPVFTPDGGAHPDDGMDKLYGGDAATALEDDHDVLLGDNGTVDRVLASPTAYQFDDLDADPLGSRDETVGVLRRRIVLHDVATTTPPFTPTSPEGTPFDGDELRGESGWDEAYGQGGDDLLLGGANDDHLEGNAGSDDLYGEAGQDDLIGGTGRTVNDDPTTADDGRVDAADELYGGDGAGGVTSDDYDVEMGDNATVLRGEPGDAWTYNTFNASVRRSVYQYDVGMVDDPADDGTAGGDLMRGEADDDLMYGQGGDDDMDGGAGDDHMQGGDGADSMLGQAGNDDMVGGTGRINLDPVQGTPGRLDVGETVMRGGDGFDWMAGDNAIIERVLTDGEWVTDPNGGVYRHVLRQPDLFDESAPFGGSRDEDQVSGADTMHGEGDHDVMYGQGNRDLADDTIGDLLTGGAGEDQLQGGEGGDRIAGNAGEDDLIGGTGKVLGQDSFTGEEYSTLDDDPTDPDLDLSEEVDAQLDFGVRDRHDGDDNMTGEDDAADGDAEGSDSDVMLGDNAIVVRKVDGGGVWVTRSENQSRDRYVWFPDLESVELPDVLTHVHGDDDMWGNDNDDEMWGQGGDDLMYGGSGDDRMQGNHASDEMHGGPQQDDMLGGTGRVNDDPVGGRPGRLDADDLMFGDDDHDVMTGDNAIVDRPIVSGSWVTLTYKSYPDATHRSVHVAGKTAKDNTAPVAPGDFRPRTDRKLTMLDISPSLEGGSPLTAGSDLMSGGAGDDDIVGQFDDSLDAGAPFTRTKAELTVLCDSPNESTLFGSETSVTTFGDVVCGNSGEDAILGDQGTIVNRPEKQGRQKLLIPKTPFSRDWVFINNTLSRLVTLDQVLEGGHDVILGGDQHDAIHSGAGGDLTNGDDGDDFIFDDDGGEIDKDTRQDASWGGRGHDTIFGGRGDDFIDVQPRTNIANYPDDPADWLFFAPPVDEQGFFRGFASVDHHYGGWDQDAFQADLGDNGPIHGDRIMDWAGAYNVFYLCPSTYGAWVSLRDQPPDGIAHMEDLALGMGAVDVKTPGTPGFREAGIVYKPDVKFNNNPPHPDTPGHFVCDGINEDDPTYM